MPPERWAALDAVKTTALLGTLLGHILIWWYGENQGAGAVVYRLDAHQTAATVAMGFMFALVSASGAIFHLHLKRLAGLPALAGRIAVLLAAGLLLGLNLHPFVILWNVFGFYASSLLLIAMIQRAFGWKGMALFSAASYLLTPLLRRGLDGSSYWTAVLIGDAQGLLSFFPLFPWFSLLGLGWLAGELFERDPQAFRRKAATTGTLLILAGLPFLSPLDFSNVFGITSRIPLAYPLFFGGIFLAALALCDALFGKKAFSAYHPLNAVGRHPLAVYLVTLLTMLALTSKWTGRGSASGFWTLNALTLAVAYAAGAALETARLRKNASLKAGTG
ncbi:MAG TPA: hypothetical protein DCM05_03360 [Elusimicrobia bacterium]|nr:hypothetical protein [Elusimicrobiota bacterium]